MLTALFDRNRERELRDLMLVDKMTDVAMLQREREKQFIAVLAEVIFPIRTQCSYTGILTTIPTC